MNRRTSFITVAVTALLTFAALTLTLGQRHHGHWRQHQGFGHHGCDEKGIKSDSIKTETKQL